MFKSSSVEGHQLKKTGKDQGPNIHVQVYLILTLSFLSIKKTRLQVELCSNEIM